MPEIWRLGEGREVSAPQRELEVKPFIRVQGRDSEGKFAKLDQEQIDRVRKELSEQRIDAYYASEQDPSRDELFDPIPQYQLPNFERGGEEMGILGDKLLKRKVKEVKEKSPKLFEERLLVVNDPQLLRHADDEAIGAFIRYGEDTGKTVTHFVINGDLTDNEQASVFSKTVDSVGTMADEIEATKWFLKKSEEMFPNADLTLIMGNHDRDRYMNYFKDRYDGIENFMKSYEEVMGINENWKVIEYGAGQYYKWHDRIFWHGHRSGSKAHIAKLELQDAGVSVTTAHINKNQYHEERNALGELSSGIVHGGFSKDNLAFMKSANTHWSQGFGEYFWSKKTGEQPYSVIIKHGNPRFIAPNGVIYDGSGYNLRKEIGLETRARKPKA